VYRYNCADALSILRQRGPDMFLFGPVELFVQQLVRSVENTPLLPETLVFMMKIRLDMSRFHGYFYA
jgi:hypothetical protein